MKRILLLASCFLVLAVCGCSEDGKKPRPYKPPPKVNHISDIKPASTIAEVWYKYETVYQVKEFGIPVRFKFLDDYGLEITDKAGIPAKIMVLNGYDMSNDSPCDIFTCGTDKCSSDPQPRTCESEPMGRINGKVIDGWKRPQLFDVVSDKNGLVGVDLSISRVDSTGQLHELFTWHNTMNPVAVIVVADLGNGNYIYSGLSWFNWNMPNCSGGILSCQHLDELQSGSAEKLYNLFLELWKNQSPPPPPNHSPQFVTMTEGEREVPWIGCPCEAPTYDGDDDLAPDCNDECPTDPNKVELGQCGCFVPETDTDGDGYPDCVDQCPADPNNHLAPCPIWGDADGDGDLDIDDFGVLQRGEPTLADLELFARCSKGPNVPTVCP